MKTWSFDSPDPDSTFRMASLLSRSIGETGLVIGLIGPLGAGKTVFAKGLASGLGIEPAAVSSPTFVIAQQYAIPDTAAPRPHILHHVDLYRLESEDELDAMGFADLFVPGAVVAVEWADRFSGVLGPARIEIELEGPSVGEASKGSRRADVTAFGEVAEAALEDWVERAERASRSRRSAPAGGIGRGPQKSVGWILVLAFLLAFGSRLSSLGSFISRPSSCREAVSVERDELGTLRVVCDERAAGDSHADDANNPNDNYPSGIGGLLYGRPMLLSEVSRRQLEALPGIGPSRSAAIVASRKDAPFESLNELERVSGIGPKTVAKLSAWLRAGPEFEVRTRLLTDPVPQ